MKYFTNLPTIAYGNNFVRNIFTRVKILNDLKKNASAYYPYILQESSPAGLRLENLAFDYYDDPDRVWLLHMTNEIVDPYYDVPLTQQQFDSYIEKKYGSVKNAAQKIVFYRNNYDQDDTILNLDGYETLIPERKKFWTPTINYDNSIIGYERIKDDVIISTNKIITMQVTSTSSLIVGEKVTQTTSGATGFVTFSNTSQLTLQHITGEFLNSYTIVGENSIISVSPASEITTLVKNISANVEVYFSPVDAYEYERELNEQKKNIYVLDSRYVGSIESSFIEAINQ